MPYPCVPRHVVMSLSSPSQHVIMFITLCFMTPSIPLPLFSSSSFSHTSPGMFSTMYADFLSDDLPLDSFSQADITDFRRKAVAAILRGELNYPVS